MVTIQFEEPNYVEYVHLLAHNIKAKLTGNAFNIPDYLGKGYVWAELLPCGMTVMVSDTIMKQDFSFIRDAMPDQYFSLQFNEYSSPESSNKNNSLNKNKYGQQLQSAVRLTHTLVSEEHMLPEGISLQSVRIFFNKDHLNYLLGRQATEEVLTTYFPFVISNENLEPIATDYRITLNELQVEHKGQPMRINFIQNRVMLLIEKFIMHLHQRKDEQTGKLKRTDNETLRLMKIEALLVKNFAVPPPTIDELSRISAMSSTKLKNDFKALYGMPIYEYYQKNRMLKAKALLLLGKYSIKEVGTMVGYSNLSHFANTFKKEFNLLPSELSVKDGVLVYHT